eukprot:403376796
MKELPYIEEIYDFETDQLESLLTEIDQLLLQGANGNQQQVQLPKGFESFDKFERKALKLKESLELELDERRQVDDVISFFVNQSGSGANGGMFGNNDLLNDDKFYQPMQKQTNNIPITQDEINNNKNETKQQQSSNYHQLSQQNLQKLPSSTQPSTQRDKDDKLETDTNFSQYMKQSTDDTQSLLNQNSHQTSQSQQDDVSDMSKKMFARNAAQKNKKDIGAFMREKLAKTKIASESMGVIQQSIAINPKNFTKKKKTTDSIDDSKSVISASTSNDKQTIYKPNLKRKQSTTGTAITKPNITATTKVANSMISGTVQQNSSTNHARKSSSTRQQQTASVTRKQSDKEASDKPVTKKQSTKEQNTTASSSIYKPANNMKSRGGSRPPIPTNNKSKAIPKNEQNDKTNKNIIKTNEQKQVIKDQEQDNDVKLTKWNENNQNDDELLGQEEIESTYDNQDIPNDHEVSSLNHDNMTSNINSYVINVDEDETNSNSQANLLNNIQVSDPLKNKQSITKSYKDDDEEEKESNSNINQGYDNQNINDQEDDDGDQDEEDQDFYQPIEDTDQKQPITHQETSHFDQDQEKLKRIFEYDNPSHQDDINELFIQPRQHLKLGDNIQDSNGNPLKFNQLNIMTEPSSTQSKKIRGKVQIFVDENAINSAVQTPKVQPILQNGLLNNQNQAQSSVNASDIVSNQLRMLEDQDNQLNDNLSGQSTTMQQNQKPANKRMEQLKQLMSNSADEERRKQEQEERLKQVRDQIQKDKETKAKQELQQTTPEIQEDQTQPKPEEQKSVQEPKTKAKQSTGLKTKKVSQQQSNKKDSQQISKIPRQPEGHDQFIDYSGHYKTFYDIFVGSILEPKTFDISFIIRDTRNTYATFVNIMDANAISMKKKFQFEQAPLEKSLQDYYKGVPDFFTLAGKSINELELEMKNRGNEIMMQAMAQQQLKNNFQQLKQKDVNDRVKQAQEKAALGAAQSDINSNIIDENRESSLYYRVVKNRTEVYDIISRAFSRKARWNELPHGLDLRNTWNLLWTWSKIKIDISKLIVWQKCNHFSGAKNVSRKDFLKRNIERAMKMSAKANQVFNMLPLTFILPKEYVGFLESFSEFEDKEGKYNYWIMKPAAKSRGRGISLVNDLTQVTYGEPIVVQRYIKNPLLINGYKFDMRIYVLVTSVNPLEVFIYKEGFGRFSTMPFSLDPTDRANKYIHLTNVSIQKYNQSNSEQDPTDLLYGGTKISIQTLKKRVQQATNVNWDEIIWPQIKEVVLKSLVACQNDIQFNPCCFELFGFDVLIDTDMKCWLIEINSSPSLARETLLDDMIKQKLIDDIVDLVDPVDFDRKRLFEVLERRINEDFKQSTTSNAYSKKLMNRDLTYILNGQVPRKYGEMPKLMGNFERIAPSPQSDYYLKLVGGQKMFGSMMKMQPEVQTQQNKQ